MFVQNEKKPEIIVFAGPNGSGKSTVTRLAKIIKPYINADEIKKANCCSDLEAAQIAEKLREKSISEKSDFTFETVLSTESEYFFRASLDFVIYKKISRKEFPVLAIELNGKEHYNDKKVIARDEKKKEICKERGFTLISVENSYARRYDFIKDILTKFFEKK